MTWWVYMVRCSDNSLYTGITTDTVRRTREHNKSSRGAAYTRARRPVTLVYRVAVDSRSAACSMEYSLKALNKKQKEAIVGGASHAK